MSISSEQVFLQAWAIKKVLEARVTLGGLLYGRLLVGCGEQANCIN